MMPKSATQKTVRLADAANNLKGLIEAEFEAERKSSAVLEADSKALPDATSPGSTEDEKVVSFDLAAQSAKFRLMQMQLLAEFIFHYEADEFSRCANPEGTRVVELNDYEILTISLLENNDIGYSYTVIPCRSAAIGNGITP